MPAAHPKSVRAAAVMAYLICLHILESSGRERFWAEFHLKFRELAPDHNVTKAYQRKFARKWYTCFRDNYHVDERPRRKQNMPSHEVKAIGRALMKGRTVEVEMKIVRGRGKSKTSEVCKIVRKRWFRSIKEFVKLNPWVEKKLLDYNITQKTLLRHLRRECPQLVRATTHPRAPMNERQMASRKTGSARLLQMARTCVTPQLTHLMHYLLRVCWIDSKTYYIGPKPRKVWARRGEDMTDVDPRGSQKNSVKVVWYIVVNALLGPIYFEYVTGTTDFHQEAHFQEYKVSCTCTPPSLQSIRACVYDWLPASQGCLHRSGPLMLVCIVQPNQPLSHTLAHCISAPVPCPLHCSGRAIEAAMKVLGAIHLNCYAPVHQIYVKRLLQPWHNMALKCYHSQPQNRELQA